MSAAAGVLISVHPVVRIVSLVLFSLFLALGNLEQTAIATVLLAILFFQAGVGCLANAWPMLRRMRWFFLSILVIYAWLTPGQPLWSSGPVAWWMPSVEGVLMAGHRLWVLTLMVLAVQWLLWGTTRGQLVSALYWLATPLVQIGFSRERFAVRVALVLETIDKVQERVSLQIKQAEVERGDLRGYANVASSLVSDVAQTGEQESCRHIEIDVGSGPPLRHWLWPLLLAGMMLMAA